MAQGHHPKARILACMAGLLKTTGNAASTASYMSKWRLTTEQPGHTIGGEAASTVMANGQLRGEPIPVFAGVADDGGQRSR